MEIVRKDKKELNLNIDMVHGWVKWKDKLCNSDLNSLGTSGIQRRRKRKTIIIQEFDLCIIYSNTTIFICKDMNTILGEINLFFRSENYDTTKDYAQINSLI